MPNGLVRASSAPMSSAACRSARWTSQEQDGRGASLAQRADYADHAGQADIQDNQVGMLVAGHLQHGVGASARATW
jgi:hypothetical protein